MAEREWFYRFYRFYRWEQPKTGGQGNGADKVMPKFLILGFGFGSPMETRHARMHTTCKSPFMLISQTGQSAS